MIFWKSCSGIGKTTILEGSGSISKVLGLHENHQKPWKGITETGKTKEVEKHEKNKKTYKKHKNVTSTNPAVLQWKIAYFANHQRYESQKTTKNEVSEKWFFQGLGPK